LVDREKCQETLRRIEVDRLVERRRTAECEPGPANAFAERNASTLTEGRNQRRRDTIESRMAVAADPLDFVMPDEDIQQARLCVRRHGQKVGQYETAPRRTQDGERRQAV